MTERDSEAARFREAFGEHYKPIRAFVFRRTLSYEDADDQTAATFATAWRRVDQLPFDSHEQRVWLFSIARKTLSNHYRGQGRERALVDRLTGLSDVVEQPVDGDVLDQVDVEEALRALGRLSERDQELILLSVWDDLSLYEISMILQTPRPAVSVRLHRAKRRLRSEFERVKEHHGPGHHPRSRAAGEPAEQESI